MTTERYLYSQSSFNGIYYIIGMVNVKRIVSTNFCIQFQILNEVYVEPVPQTKKIPHCEDEFEAGEKNKIMYESL